MCDFKPILKAKKDLYDVLCMFPVGWRHIFAHIADKSPSKIVIVTYIGIELRRYDVLAPFSWVIRFPIKPHSYISVRNDMFGKSIGNVRGERETSNSCLYHFFGGA